jgi:hypothetical protein
VTPQLFLGPGLFLLVYGAIRGAPAAEYIFALVWTAVPTTINWYNNFPLKRVRLDPDRNMVWVSNFMREVAIPLGHIHDVRGTGGEDYMPKMGSWRWPARRVTFAVRPPSSFGSRIIFIPGYEMRDVVADLQSAIQHAPSGDSKGDV